MATLTIIDDDSDTPPAHFEIAQDIPLDPQGRLAILAEPGASTDVDVVVDDLPPGGTTISYTSTADGQIHTLAFNDDPRRTIQVNAPKVPAGQAQATDVLQLLNPSTARNTQGDGLVSSTVLLAQLPEEVQQCMTCLILYALSAILEVDCQTYARVCKVEWYCPFPPAEASAQGLQATRILDAAADLESLRRYRDEVLLASPGGDYYLQLYRDQSLSIGTAILQRPTLIHRVAEVWELWLPAVAAQVDGQGASFVITGEMQDALLGVMTEFAEVGGAELAVLMADFRTALDLEHAAGATAADLQESIETSEMGGEQASWGDVKSMFR